MLTPRARYALPVARVLVVHPPVSVARDFIDYPYFADLGAVQLAAVLRDAGHAVDLVDAYALPGSSLTWRADGRAHLGAPIDEVLARATAEKRDLAIVAFTPFHRPPRRDELLGTFLEQLRRGAPGMRIVLADLYQSGQHYVEADGSAVLASYPEASAWVKYEGEVTVPSLVHASGRGERIDGVHRGADVPSLDALPLPAWDLVDLPAHDAFHARVVQNLGRGPWAFPIDGRTLPLVTSRGCPFRCAHCSSNPGREAGAPKTQRRLSTARLREHMEALVRVHGATRLEVLDELLNVNERHFDAFLEVASELGTAFDVPNGMRADYLEPRHFAAMRGRVTTVSVSAESGVQRVVTEVVGKQLDLACIEKAAAGAHAAEVPLMVHFMIGLPGETAEEINGTLDFAAGLFARHGARPAVQFATPLPGTALARERSLPVVDDWGPRFQMEPTPLAAVGADDLRRFKSTFDAWMRAAEGPPTATVNVTYVCNNDCVFCAVGPRTGIASHPTGQRRDLDALRRRGVRAIEFDGGEPTTNPELVPLVRHARALGFQHVGLTTNGRMCFYEEYARKLVTSGLTSLVFSVHGPDAELHARHVGVPEAFEQTIGGVRHCVKHAPPGVRLGMSTTVTRHNAGRLEELGELACRLGLHALVLRAVAPFGAASASVAAAPETTAVAVQRVIDGYGDRLAIEVRDLPYCQLPGYERFVEGDPGMLSHRRFTTNTDRVHLAQYVADQRVREPVCLSCPHAVFCGGFYDTSGAPDPAWIAGRSARATG
jgi:MoaA/NifB/PqqE/SkfB family radical SAM enzyme